MGNGRAAQACGCCGPRWRRRRGARRSPSYWRISTGASRLTRSTRPYTNSSATRSASTSTPRPRNASHERGRALAVGSGAAHARPRRAPSDALDRLEQVLGHEVGLPRPARRVVQVSSPQAVAASSPARRARPRPTRARRSPRRSPTTHERARSMPSSASARREQARAAACGSRSPGGRAARPPWDGAGRSRRRRGARRRPSIAAPQRGVDLVDHGLGEVAAGDARLVGDHDGQAAAPVDEPHGVHRPGEEPEARDVVHVADLVGQRAVAVHEDGGRAPTRQALRRAAARLGEHAVDAHARHAAMVDRALAQHAGRAVRRARARRAARVADGRRLAPVGRAEDRHHRHAQRGRQVHRARVVGEQEPQRARARRRARASVVSPHRTRAGAAHQRGDAPRQRPLGGAAHDRDAARPLRRPARSADRGEALGQPRLAVPKNGAGVDADPGPVRPPRSVGRARAHSGGQRSDTSGAARTRRDRGREHRPIVVHLAAAPDSVAGHPRRAREQRPRPSVA